MLTITLHLLGSVFDPDEPWHSKTSLFVTNSMSYNAPDRGSA